MIGPEPTGPVDRPNLSKDYLLCSLCHQLRKEGSSTHEGRAGPSTEYRSVPSQIRRCAWAPSTRPLPYVLLGRALR
jgi:hypothetical protein